MYLSIFYDIRYVSNINGPEAGGVRLGDEVEAVEQEPGALAVGLGGQVAVRPDERVGVRRDREHQRAPPRARRLV